jgi:2,3-bisphosphoglycerate-dependent phosphoglycerate mutase
MADQGRTLILVRHSLSEIVTCVPASQWHLSEEGRRRCEGLAERLAAYEPHVIVTSLEPKAIETGQIVARVLGIPCETAPNLHEHERPKEEHFGTREQFEAQVSRLFERPGELIFGNETADEAHQRFSSAIGNVLETHHSGAVAIVTHGTVLTLFVARAAGIEPVSFWKQLGLPAFVALSLPDLTTEAVENVLPDA